jgi:hypothetical protein
MMGLTKSKKNSYILESSLTEYMRDKKVTGYVFGKE